MALRTNLVLNPGFTTGVGGWTATGVQQQANGLFLNYRGDSGTPQGTNYAYTTAAGGTANIRPTALVPVTPGVQYTASAWGFRPNGTLRLDIDWYDSSGAYLSSSSSSTTISSAWVRCSTTGTAPAGATQARPFLAFLSLTAGQTIGVDGALFERGGLGYYFDGSYPGCEWTGSANGSFSTESEGYRRNLVPNPSFENDTTGYTISFVRSGVTATSSVVRSTGSIAGKAGAAYGFLNITGNGQTSTADVIVRAPNLKVAGGDSYTFSAAFQNVGFTSRCGIDWLDAAGTQLSASAGPWLTHTSTFVRSSMTVTAPAGAAFARPTLWTYGPADTTQRAWRFDALMLEEAPGGDYFDGSFPDGQWVDGAHSSASVIPAVVEHAAAVTTTSSSPTSARAVLDPGQVRTTTTSASTTVTDGSVGRSGATVTSSASTTTANARRITTGAAVTSSESTTSLVADTPAATTTSSPSTAAAAARLTMPVRTEQTVAPSSAVASGDIVPASGSQTASVSTSTAAANVTAPVAVTTTSASPTTAAAYVGKAAAVVTSSASSSSAGSTHYGQLRATTTSSSSSTANGVRRALVAAVTSSASFSTALAEGPTVTVSYGYAWATAGLLTEATVVTSSASTDLVGGYADMPVAVETTGESTTVAELYAVIDLAVLTVSESDTFAAVGPPTKLGAVVTSSPSTASVSSQLVVPVAINGVGVLGSYSTASAFVFTPVFQAPAGPVVPQTPHPVMRLLVAETRTGRIGWELPYTQIGWNAPLNKAGTMTATLTLDEVLESVYAQGAADPAKALRETLTGPLRFSYVITYGNAPVWAGPMRPAVSFAADTNDIQVGGTQLESLFEDRVLIGNAAASVPLNDASRDVIVRQSSPAGALYRVALHAIDSTGGRQARGLPITCARPPVNLIGDEDFVYRSYDLVPAWKAMTDLMDRDDGPDMRLHPYLVEGGSALFVQWDLQIGEPLLPSSATPGDDGPLPWTFTDKTSRIEMATDAVGMATTYFTSGDGQDRAKLMATASSTTLTGAGWPAIEKVESGRSSESDADKLGAFTRGLIAAHETPTTEWKVSTPIDGANPLGSYRAGDEAFLDVRAHALLEPGRYRRRITEVSHDGGPMVTVTCDTDDNEMAGV